MVSSKTAAEIRALCDAGSAATTPSATFSVCLKPVRWPYGVHNSGWNVCVSSGEGLPSRAAESGGLRGSRTTHRPPQRPSRDRPTLHGRHCSPNSLTSRPVHPLGDTVDGPAPRGIQCSGNSADQPTGTKARRVVMVSMQRSRAMLLPGNVSGSVKTSIASNGSQPQYYEISGMGLVSAFWVL